MTESVSGLLWGLCMAAVLGGVVQLLSPGGFTERALKLLVSLFVLCAVLVPVHSLLRRDWDFAFVQEISPQDTAGQAVLDSAALAMEQTAQGVLEKYGQTGQVEVEAVVRDGEVHAGRFVIYGVDTEKAQEIADEIYALTGETPIMENKAADAPSG